MSNILMNGTEPIGQVAGLTADNVEYSEGVSVKDKIDGTPEIITNANGTAYKFPSGLMICTKTLATTLNSSADWTAWGSLYIATITGGNWAEPFISKPNVSATNDSEDSLYFIGDLKNPTENGFTSVRILRVNAPSAIACSVSVIAIGRWKA